MPELEKIGLQAVLEDEQFQAALKRYMHGEQQMREATAQSAQQQSGAWNFLAVAAGAAVGTIVGQIVTNLIPKLQEAAMAGINSLTQWGEGLDKLSDQFGFSGQDAAKWAVAMKKVGVAPEEGGFQLNYFNRQLDDAAKKLKAGDKTVPPFAQSMKKLGVNLFDASGKLKTFDQLMPDVMEAFKKLPQGVESSAIAMDLFGARGGTKFLDFLRQGKVGLADASKLAKEFGLDLSTNQVDAIEQYGFAWNEVKLKIQGMLVQLGTAPFPAFQELVKVINEQILPAVNGWITANKDKLLQGLKDLGDWIKNTLLPTLLNFYTWITTNVPIIQKTIVDAFNKEIKPKLDAFKTWMDTDGKQALQTFYDKLMDMKPFVEDWLRLIKDLKDSIQSFIDILGAANEGLDETGNHFNLLNTLVSGAMDNMKGAIDAGFGTMRALQEAWQKASKGDLDGFLAAIVSVFAATWKVTLPGMVSGFAEWMGKKMGELTIAIAQALWNNVDAIFDALVAPFRNAIDWIQTNWGWSSPPTLFVKLGADVSKALEMGLSGANMGRMVTQAVMPAAASSIVNNSYSRSMVNNFNAPIYGANYLDSRINRSIDRFNKGIS